MKIIGKFLSFIGVIAGLLFLANRAVAELYERTFHRKELYGEEYTLPEEDE